ncbi:MAG: hypothetical protein Q9171_007582, partial [Xanthocarpia ochracea]
SYDDQFVQSGEQYKTLGLPNAFLVPTQSSRNSRRRRSASPSNVTTQPSPDQSEDTMSIQAACISCLEAFEKLIKRIETTEYHKENEVPKSSWIAQLRRLYTWAHNVNALEMGDASIDNLLRNTLRQDLGHVRSSIPKILQGLEEDLMYITEVFIPALGADLGEDPNDPETKLQCAFGSVQTRIRNLEQFDDVIPGTRKVDARTRSTAANDAMLANVREPGQGMAKSGGEASAQGESAGNGK